MDQWWRVATCFCLFTVLHGRGKRKMMDVIDSGLERGEDTL